MIRYSFFLLAISIATSSFAFDESSIASPVLLATNVHGDTHSIAADSDYVYYPAAAPRIRNKIMRVPIAGGSPQEFLVAPGSWDIAHLQISGEHLYWVSLDRENGFWNLHRICLNGHSQPEEVATSVFRYKLDGSDLYFLQENSSSLVHQSVTTGKQTILFSTEELYNASEIAVDRSSVYLLFSGVGSTPQTATGTLYRVPKVLGKTVQLASQLLFPQELAQVGQHLYWQGSRLQDAHFLSGSLFEFDLNTGKLKTLLDTDRGHFRGLTSHHKSLYFSYQSYYPGNPYQILRLRPETGKIEKIFEGIEAAGAAAFAIVRNALLWASGEIFKLE